MMSRITEKLEQTQFGIMSSMKLTLFTFTVLFLFPTLVLAAPLTFVTPTGSDAYTVIDEPILKHAYYGELRDFPHGYKIITSTPLLLSVEISEPANRHARKNMSGIIVREIERGVEEVARLEPSQATWEKTYSVKSGDSYRQGATYREEVTPGTYYVEVSNGDNLGKYVLTIGTEDDRHGLGLFATMKEIYLIKRYFDKPFFMVLQSPYYYVPALLLMAVGLGWHRKRRRNEYA